MKVLSNIIMKIRAWVLNYCEGTPPVERGDTIRQWGWMARDWSEALAGLAMRADFDRPTGDTYYTWFNGQTLIAEGIDSPEEGQAVEILQEDIRFEGPYTAGRIIDASLFASCIGASPEPRRRYGIRFQDSHGNTVSKVLRFDRNDIG